MDDFGLGGVGRSALTTTTAALLLRSSRRLRQRHLRCVVQCRAAKPSAEGIATNSHVEVQVGKYAGRQGVVTKGPDNLNTVTIRLDNGQEINMVNIAHCQLLQPELVRDGEARGADAAAGGPVIVEAEVVADGGGAAVVAAVLERADSTGVPIRNQLMEYVRVPTRSPLMSCGIPELEPGGLIASGVLVRGLRVGGADFDHAEVGAAVLCLMMGGLDEAHNLATPHCWASSTVFGGLAKPGSSVRQDAAYCNAIVHRMEAEKYGPGPPKYGTGFETSSYWVGRAFPSREHAIFPELREVAESLVADCGDARAALRVMGPKWDPHRFNRLCADALESRDDEVLAFCGAVQAREVRLLFDHIRKAG